MNWKLTLAYDGTDFHGWQVQPGHSTIQGELADAIERVTGDRVLPQGSGRTDAGVHARAQVASCELAAPIPPENLHRALNRTLPSAIRILNAEHAPPDFHARHSVVAKTYEYRIYRGEICPPWTARYVYALNWPLDVEKMQQAASLVIGEHDFTSFAATDPDLTARQSEAHAKPKSTLVYPYASLVIPTEATKGSAAEGPAFLSGAHQRYFRFSNVRTIHSSEWTEAEDLLIYKVRGNGFLHHMVRNLVGTFLDTGRSQIQPEDIPTILQQKSRTAAGATAPARGLFLHSVEY